MQSLLDIIGATIIGGLLMITMFTSMITIQENNTLLRGEMQVINDLEYISNLIDSYYMDKIGYELPGAMEAFPLAQSNSIWFNTKVDVGDESIYLVKISTGPEETGLGYPLTIEWAGMPTVGPIYLGAPIEIEYYDVNGNVLIDAALVAAPIRANIRSVQIELTVYHGEYGTDTMRSRALVFRKYFPNLAI
ncbi:MAG: hypothetical protein K9N06_08540 [Candidatus Cloacimonetes bacterium]|nr:hypothetical protein [Candidatus Cloacimonadota bacterium]